MSAPAPWNVLRYEVPVDDQWHRVEYVGDLAYVAARRPAVVEFWATPAVQVPMTHDGMGRLKSIRYEPVPSTTVREFRVFGTGQPIDGGLWVGTALAAAGLLVWHLFARDIPTPS